MAAQHLPNPFVYGGAILNPDQFFGRRAELGFIFDRLKNMQSVSVVGERRIGKSTLLRQVHQTGKQPLGDGVHLIFVSLQNVKDVKTFYQNLCKELGVSGSGFQDLERGVKNRGKVVACLDEFESVAGQPGFTRDFFDDLRTLAETGRFALIVATQQSLADLCRNQQIATSPFWNVFRPVYLGLVTQQEAEDFIRNRFKEAGQDVTPEEVTRVLQLAGRFPFFLQMACSYLFEMKVGQAPEWEKNFEREAKDHLIYLWNQRTRQEKEALRWVVEVGGRLPKDEVLWELERRGLLVQEEGKPLDLWVFSEAFEVIVRNPPPPPPGQRESLPLWKRFFRWFKGGEFGLGPTGPTAKVQVERPKDEDER